MSEHKILVHPSKKNLVEFHFIKKAYTKMNNYLVVQLYRWYCCVHCFDFSSYFAFLVPKEQSNKQHHLNYYFPIDSYFWLYVFQCWFCFFEEVFFLMSKLILSLKFYFYQHALRTSDRGAILTKCWHFFLYCLIFHNKKLLWIEHE